VYFQRDDAERFGDRELTWVEFQELFNGNFFPVWVRKQKIYEFIELTQGDKSVAQYEVEFLSLARFAPDLVSTEEKKAVKFHRGLNVEIRYAMGGVRFIDYATVVHRAYTLERERIELRIVQAASNGVSSSQGHKNDKKRKRGANSVKNAVEAPWCKTCGKRHRDPCHIVKGACYLCGQTGHLQKDYPQNSGIAIYKEVVCYQCGRKGHRANVCNQPQQPRG